MPAVNHLMAFPVTSVYLVYNFILFSKRIVSHVFTKIASFVLFFYAKEKKQLEKQTRLGGQSHARVLTPRLVGTQLVPRRCCSEPFDHLCAFVFTILMQCHLVKIIHLTLNAK